MGYILDIKKLINSVRYDTDTIITSGNVLFLIYPQVLRLK